MVLQFMAALPQRRGQFMPVAGANPQTTATRDGRLGQLRQRVYEQLRSAVEQGRLPAGTRLPPSREHAASLGVSRNTVLWAVQRLQAEGLCGSARG
jgi:GntR family transcriptional regulator/MocR family aminotransferase